MTKDQGVVQELAQGKAANALPQWEQLPGEKRQELVHTLSEMLLSWLAWQTSQRLEVLHEPVS